VLTLYRHDGAYSLRAHNVELMSTRRHFSEEKLAELTCDPLRGGHRVQVLIGGLGFGYTLKAALRSLGPDARVVVAELLGAVIEWNRNPEYALAGDALADPRVEVRHADVMTVLRRGPGQFDAIMLDVDNGADSFTTAGNADLYREGGVHIAAAALAPGGRLAYWSASDDPAFERTLRDAGLAVEVLRVRAHPTSGVTHTLYIGQDGPARPRR
jgi:spermidine synthase